VLPQGKTLDDVELKKSNRWVDLKDIMRKPIETEATIIPP
jgi:hypothetical protein